MSHLAKSLVTGVVVIVSGVFALAGCTADAAPEETSLEEANATNEETVGSTEQAIISGWTSYTSEEYAPVGCDGSSLASWYGCSGSYCDNNRLYCQPTAGSRGDSYWTTYFSEESTNYRYCNSGYWVTGISCKGSYCDNIALQCSRMYNVSPRNCYWTGWLSEENGTLSFGAGYYARGAQCSGRYCDNKRFYVCQQ